MSLPICPHGKEFPCEECKSQINLTIEQLQQEILALNQQRKDIQQECADRCTAIAGQVSQKEAQIGKLRVLSLEKVTLQDLFRQFYPEA